MQLAAIIAAIVVLAATVAWFAGEQYYDNCVSEAKAAYPVLEASGGSNDPPRFGDTDEPRFGGGTDPNPGASAPEFSEARLRQRRTALDDCSRLPF